MAVVGFDFGNSSCVISICRKGSIEVVMNDCSNRQTPSVVGYTDSNRQIGEAGLAQHVGNYKNTVFDLKRIIGASWSDQEFAAEAKQMPYKVVADNERVLIEVQYNNDSVLLTPEQVTGALFTQLKILAERVLEGVRVVDCVVGVPHFFTDRMRRAVLDAANIAGLNVLRLINEGTAIALQYGLLRTLPEKDAIKVMFFDLGHTHTTATLVSFVAGSLTILGTSSLRNLGCRDFDRVIYNSIAEFALSKYRIDINSNVKASLRVFKQCEKIKKMLSANLEAPYNIECIMNDIDVKGTLTREEFEKLSADMLERILLPVKEVLAYAGVESKDIDAFEILGGGSRIPCVRRVLKDLVGKELATTNNADESVARGCALQCAMLSPNMRVRDFAVNDVTQYAYTVGWSSMSNPNQEDEAVTLFDKFSSLNTVKQILLTKSESFQLNARYTNPSELPRGYNPYVATFSVKGLPDVVTKQKLKVKLDHNGLISLSSAQALEEVTTESSDAPMEVENTASTEDAATDDKKKKKYKRTELIVESRFGGGLSAKELTSYIEVEGQQFTNDRIISETAEKRNELEAFIYDNRTDIQGKMAVYWKEEQLGGLFKLLDDSEEWLTTEEGETSQKSEYVRRLTDLKAKFEPMKRRKYESENRDQAVSLLRSTITKYRMQATSPDSKYAHITAEEKQNVLKCVDEATAALETALQQQQARSIAEDPAVYVSQLDDKRALVEKTCEPIMSKPVPKPAVVPPAANPSPDVKADAAKPADAKPETTPAEGKMDLD